MGDTGFTLQFLPPKKQLDLWFLSPDNRYSGPEHLNMIATLGDVQSGGLEGAANMTNRKSVVLSLVLTFFFGPFGMLYSTVSGAIIMLILYVALGIPTLGWALAGLHPIAVIWGALAADRANR